MGDKLRVAELFAGVGGFRVGLNNVQLKNDKVIEEDNFDFVYANQWEPSTKRQHAYEVYINRFGDKKEHSNKDISTVTLDEIPEHDLLVGGFPCQDYSVARSLSGEKGIHGKKGVLWWEIHRIIEGKKPSYVLLENVDRLLKAPSKQRGRDFGIMLKSLYDLGYDVEWRVINAADYMMPQRRRRVFIFAYNKQTDYYIKHKKIKLEDLILKEGIFPTVFPIQEKEYTSKEISTTEFNKQHDIVEISDSFELNFNNSGAMKNGKVLSFKTKPISNEEVTNTQEYKLLMKNNNYKGYILKDILENDVEQIQRYALTKEQIEKFKHLRGAKKKERTNPNGDVYYYSEGSMSEVDDINLPGRTMLTSESSVNRSTHILEDKYIKSKRFITPIEAERLNMFPDNWTDVEDVSEKRRYFFMGNALVTGIVYELGLYLKEK